jgi:phosphoglycolate phosphatase-like HAD superfamily hydrolase
MEYKAIIFDFDYTLADAIVANLSELYEFLK